MPQTAIDAPLRVARQQGAVHVDGAAGHGIAGDDVLRHRVFGKSFRRDDLDAVLFHLVQRVEQTGGTAVVIHVGVAVDHRGDRALPLGLVDEGQRCLGGLRGD